MFNLKRGFIIVALSASTVLLSGCSVGTSSLFVHPSEQGYEYEVTFDTLGGHINQVEKRVAYFANDSLLYQPSGTSGMLVAPKNGNKTLDGWYTKCTTEETASGTVYHFDDADLWDFSADRVNDENAPEHKLVLYAKWVENPSVNFVDAENPESEALLKWSIDLGSVLKKPTSTEPKKSGYVLMDYYKDPECTEKFEFNTTVDEDRVSTNEDGSVYINIYCKFQEGQAIRVKTAEQLKAMANDPAAEYVLANDIDMTGIDWTPIENFSGSLNGNGYAIKNLTLTAKNKVTGIASKKAQEKSYGLFATLENAKVFNLTISNAHIVVDKSSNVKLCVGSLAGRAKKSTIENCTFDQIIIDSDAACSADVVVAAIVAGDSSVKVNDCTMNGVNLTGVKSKGNVETINEY